jgi:uncharacterized membrane protein
MKIKKILISIITLVISCLLWLLLLKTYNKALVFIIYMFGNMSIGWNLGKFSCWLTDKLVKDDDKK